MPVKRYLLWSYLLVIGIILLIVAVGLHYSTSLYLSGLMHRLTHQSHSHAGHHFPIGQARSSLMAIRHFLHAMIWGLGITGLLAVTFGVLLSQWLASRLTGPIYILQGGAHAIQRGATSIQIEPEGPQEIRALASAFNELAQTLQEAEADHKRALEDLSHEIRTPLMGLLGHTQELGLQNLVSPEMLQHLTREIDRLRQLAANLPGATPIAGYLFHKQHFDLRRVLEHVLVGYQTLCHKRHITLEFCAEDSFGVLGEQNAFIEVFHNLLNNALKYTPDHGVIRVSLIHTAHYRQIVFEDSGKGIAPELSQTLFDRYVHYNAVDGQGLGLNIVRSIITAHGGTISAESSSLGGAAFAITLPVEIVQASSIDGLD